MRAPLSIKNKVAFVPSPYKQIKYIPEEFEDPKPPEKDKKPRFPLIASLAPLAMGVVMYSINPNPMSIAFIALSPIIMIANFLDGIFGVRRKYKKEYNEYLSQMEALKQKRLQEARKQEETILQRFPSAKDLFEVAVLRRPMLWCRSENSDDFLCVRFGKSILDLKENTSFGIAGEINQAYLGILTMILQICVLHRPRDIRITYVSNPAYEDYFLFIQALPHFIPLEKVEYLAEDSQCIIFAIDTLFPKVEIPQKDPQAGKEKKPPIIGVSYSPAVTSLPQTCSAYISTDLDTLTYVQSGEELSTLPADYFAYDGFNNAAGALSEIYDPEASLNSANSVPDIVLPEFDLDSFSKVGWQEHNFSLTAEIGRSGEGLEEISLVKDGPHALIGGTTGSGKSEFLQSWILSLAFRTSPAEVNFLLVDYKGGSAFSCISELPHCVGMVTDLSPVLFKRVQLSLSAEVKAREVLFSKFGAKDLRQMQEEHTAEAPPALVIIVDEFAALITDIPEFMDSMLNIAARGRSLGLHIVLATQRPAGVIKDNLRANTNLRIALRVSDEHESADIIGAPDASSFDIHNPGRLIMKKGASSRTAVQSTFVGESGYLQLAVNCISQVFEASGIPAPERPWLEELPNYLEFTSSLGLADNPGNQCQEYFNYNPAEDGNLCIYGSLGMGKTTFLETLAFEASQMRAAQTAIYILSAGGALKHLEALPNVGLVADMQIQELVQRVFDLLLSEIKIRQQVMIDAKANSFADILGEECKQIYLIIDDYSLFKEVYEAGFDSSITNNLAAICSAGQAVGVNAVLSCDRASSMAAKMQSCFAGKIVMNLISEQDFLLLGADKKTMEAFLPGRALYEGLEMQIACIGQTVLDKQKRVAALAEELSDLEPAPKISCLPEIIPFPRADFEEKEEQEGSVISLGIKYSDLSVYKCALKGVIIVSGPALSGKSNFIELLKVQQPNVAVFKDIQLVQDDQKQREIAKKIQEAKAANSPCVIELTEPVANIPWLIQEEIKAVDLSVIFMPDDRFSRSYTYIPMPKCRQDDFCTGRALIFANGKAEKVQTYLFG